MGEVMADNANLNAAKKAKNDEFYTLYADIEKEIQTYYEYNPDFLKDKVLLLPCDDHSKSNFVKYFVDNFEKFQLKELVSSCYVENGKGKVLHKTRKGEQTYQLKGNGDFRSEEVTALRDKADAVITNPPFSLFRAFFDWVSGKEFSIVGTINGVGYKNVIPWLVSLKVKVRKHSGKFESIKLGSACWYTNIKHEAPPIINLKDRDAKALKAFDNYDALNVDKVANIPSTHKGVLGVPVTFMLKHNPKQFKIIWIKYGADGKVLRIDGRDTYVRILIKAMS